MGKSERKLFAEAIFLCGEIFNEPVSDAKVEAYWLSLVDLPTEEVIRALHTAIKEDFWFPRPAHIRQRIGGSEENRAMVACMEVMREIRSCGRYQTPTLTDLAEKVIWTRLGGWRAVCDIPTEKLQRQFVEHYRELLREENKQNSSSMRLSPSTTSDP